MQDADSRLQRLMAQSPTLQIGFLGEWNSGKSSLINVLLGRKILPVMPKPTTGSITEIVSEANLTAVQYCCVDGSGTETTITADIFAEIASGARAGRARLCVPPGGVLMDGYCLIDTPGLASLSQGHTDITLQYLPFLDGAVVCHDVNRGELPRSVLEFLARPDVKVLAHRILFALTHADDKPSESARNELIERIRKQVAEFFLQETGGHADMAVVAVSAAPDEARRALVPLGTFVRAFEESFVRPRRELEDTRRLAVLREWTESVDVALQEKEKALTFNNSEFADREKEIVAEQAKIQALIQAEEQRFEQFRRRLARRLGRVAEAFVPEFRSATETDLGQVAERFSEQLTIAAKAEIDKLGEEYELPGNITSIGGFVAKIKTIIKTTDWAVMIATAAATALLAPGATTAANAEEALGGAAFRRAGVALSRVKATGKRGADASDLLRRVLGQLGDLIRTLNPLEYVGELVSQKLKGAAAEVELPRLASAAAMQIGTDLESTLLRAVLGPARERLELQREALRAVIDDRQCKLDEIALLREDLETDRARLRDLAGGKHA